MTIYYSQTTNGFYDSSINSDIPSDSVEISVEKHQELLTDQSNGKIITSDKKGNPIAIDPPAPTREQTIVIYNRAVQNNLDFVAKSWGYDSMIAAVSYANSTNSQYKVEAEALISWRDSCWSMAYEIEAGKLPSSAEAFMALLPKAPAKPNRLNN